MAGDKRAYDTRTDGERTPAGAAVEDAGGDGPAEKDTRSGDVQRLQRHLDGRGTARGRKALHVRNQR